MKARNLTWSLHVGFACTRYWLLSRCNEATTKGRSEVRMHLEGSIPWYLKNFSEGEAWHTMGICTFWCGNAKVISPKSLIRCTISRRVFQRPCEISRHIMRLWWQRKMSTFILLVSVIYVATKEHFWWTHSEAFQKHVWIPITTWPIFLSTISYWKSKHIECLYKWYMWTQKTALEEWVENSESPGLWNPTLKYV